MKRKILIVLLMLVILSQAPFAIRRYRLQRLNSAIQQLAAQRVPQTNATDYVDYKGVIHVHSFLGGHSRGNFPDLIAAARANQLRFVVMTEHPQPSFDTAAMTLNGIHEDVLFINGNEVSTANGDRLLLVPGAANAAILNTKSTQEIVDQQKAAGGLSFAAYPAESQNWQSTTVDGVEIYNLFTNARRINRLVTFFDGLWSYRSYGDLMFANFFVRPNAELQRWDAAVTAGNRKFVAIAGNDAHANVGLSLNDSSGNEVLGVKLDPYERSFRLFRTHVLIAREQPLTRESLLQALALGHCYVSFDLFNAADGFEFRVNNSAAIMGDEVSLGSQPTLEVRVPLNSRIVLYRNGAVITQTTAISADFPVNSPGAYRVELYLDSLPAPASGQPWIISNPIYVR